MKYTILSLDPKELEVLQNLLRHEIETRGYDLGSSTSYTTHPEDLLWMTESAHKSATLLHKIYLAAPKKKRGK
jgi:hypothetical protein